MAKPSEEVVERLRWVQEQILANPAMYDQNIVVMGTSCGTACCLAGWLHINKVGLPEHQKLVQVGYDHEFDASAGKIVFDTGVERLGLDTSVFGYDAEWPNLFSDSEDWPAPYSDEYELAEAEGDGKAMAQIAVRRIDHFIETGE